VIIQQTPSGHAELPMLSAVKGETNDESNEDDKMRTARPTSYQRLVQIIMEKEVSSHH